VANLIAAVSGSALARRIVRGLRLHKLGNAWLRRFPRIKRLPGSKVVWRATRMESFALAHEMFEKGNLYDPNLLPKNFTTFADLGCNVGFFTCWLANLAQGRPLKGLMFDANPDAVAEASWHAQANQWPQVFGIHGILGENDPSGAVDFFLYESNICSTSQLPDIERMGLKGKWTKISVPCVSLESKWRQHFGDERCHVLKVDIEGSELQFLKAEAAFLKQVDSIIIEWHKWRVSLEELKTFLDSHGLPLVKILEEGDQMGTAFFARRAA
jgi:FkbM family methyltransferase